MEVDFKHSVVVNAKDAYNAVDWCRNQFGTPWVATNRAGVAQGACWCSFWCGPEQHGSYIFHFRKERDMLLFTLRWGQSS